RRTAGTARWRTSWSRSTSCATTVPRCSCPSPARTRTRRARSPRRSARRPSRSPRATLPARSQAPDGVAGLRPDVVQVVGDVVPRVPGERLDREDGAVAAPAGTLAVAAPDRLEPVGERPSGVGQGDDDGGRVLRGVRVLEGGGVLVPVGELGVLRGE